MVKVQVEYARIINVCNVNKNNVELIQMSKFDSKIKVYSPEVKVHKSKEKKTPNRPTYENQNRFWQDINFTIFQV